MASKAVPLLLWLALVVPAHAQDAAPLPAVAAPAAEAQAPAVPPDLQARIEAAETRDYTAARLALAASPDYRPYAFALRESALMDKWVELLEDKKATLEERQALVDTLARELPLSYPANSAIARWYADRYEASEPRDPMLLEQGRPYYLALEGIIDSITGSGDGRSQDTAWRVIHIGEEYLVLSYLEYEVVDRLLVFGTDGRPFDVFRVKDAEGKDRTVHFDVSLFYGKGGD